MSMSSLSSLSDESTSDEEIVRVRRPRQFFSRKDPLELYAELEFKIRFRVNKNTVMELLHLLGGGLEPMTHRNQSISSKLQLLITLRFFATGAFQQLLGDDVGVHKSSVSRIVRRVVHRIAGLKPQHIRMPSENEFQEVKMGFYQIRGFPKVLGAVDCTHIPITSPGGPNAEVFRNRKGYFSINVQGVCDSTLAIRNIIARWPGSVHDSTIFNDSPLCADFEAGVYGNTCLLGDSGYPCKNYLLTPLLNPRTAQERAYNRAHISTRNTIERCFGVLKRRFPCLSKGFTINLQSTLTSIVACAVLHNICLKQNDEVVELPEELEGYEEPDVVVAQDINTAVRAALINTVF